jgi:hypothetical protein
VASGLGRDWVLLWKEGDARGAYFNITTGTIGTVSAGVSASITSNVDGSYLCAITLTPTSTATVSFWICSANETVNYSGDVTKGINIQYLQLETGTFATPKITTTTTTVTRAATNLTLPTAGVLPVNDFGIWGEVIPGAIGQGAVYPFTSYVSSTNHLGVYVAGTSGNVFIKVIDGVNISLTGPGYVYTANTPFQYQAFQSRVYGMGIRVKEQGGAWSAWALKNDADGRLDAPIAATYQIGARNNANHFAGYYPGLAIIQHADPKFELERLTLKYGE